VLEITDYSGGNLLFLWKSGGTLRHSWLRHCATSRKVVGLITV